MYFKKNHNIIVFMFVYLMGVRRRITHVRREKRRRCEVFKHKDKLIFSRYFKVL